MSPITDTIRAELAEAQNVLAMFLNDPENLNRIEAAAKLMAGAVKAEGKILSCGNGGSMCVAMHFAEELTGRYRNDRPAIPAIAISDASHLSCVANDYGTSLSFRGMWKPWVSRAMYCWASVPAAIPPTYSKPPRLPAAGA